MHYKLWVKNMKRDAGLGAKENCYACEEKCAALGETVGKISFFGMTDNVLTMHYSLPPP